MINQASEPSVSRHCALVDPNRTGVLYTRDRRGHAARQGQDLRSAGPHATILMRRMASSYMPPAASIPPRALLIYPCMVGGMKIDWANQVWASEFAYLRMANDSLGPRQRARGSGRIDSILL
jgi:hypothetical protein